MQKFFTLKRSLLIVVLLMAAVLRLWNLGGVPPSTSMDEASIGYNAYSVLKTGVDEYKTFPLVSQRAFDDWRRSTYLLMDIPFVGILGLQDYAVRLPAALLSLLTVWAVYYIVILFLEKKSKIAEWIALLSAFFLAINPWHIYISRVGHESNACLSFLVFGVLFFLQGLNKPWKLFVSIFLFALSMISYYSGQVFIPLFGLGLLVIYRKELFGIFSKNKKLILPLILSGILLIPFFWSVFSPSALVRFNGTSTFSPNAHWDLYIQEIALHNAAEKNHDILGIALHHRYLYPVKVLVSAYVIHFSPSWLFANPSNRDMFKAPYTGLLYLWELPFILLGFGVILFTKLLHWKSKSLIFLWFFLGPLPAAIAVGVPHPNRAYNSVITWEFFTAFGVGYLIYTLGRLRVVTVAMVALLVVVGLFQFCKNYFVTFPYQQSNSFYYAFSKMMPYVLSQQNKYQHIVFDNTDNMYQSYMGYLWYTNYNPATYQRMGGTISGGYAVTHKIGKYSFRPIDWEKDENLKNTLIVGNISDFPKEIQGKVFTNVDGKTGIEVVAR